MADTQPGPQNTLTQLQRLAASGTVADAWEIVKIGETHPAEALEALEEMGCPGIAPQLVAEVAKNGNTENVTQALRMLIDSIPEAATNLRRDIETEIKQLLTVLSANAPEFHQP